MALLAPALHLTGPVRLEATGITAWRVRHRDRGVIGHVRVHLDGADELFVARRFYSSVGDFRDVGTFASMDDAVDVLLHST